MAIGELKSKRLELADDAEEIYEYVEQNYWGDGHPVIPPTEERVRRFLSKGRVDPQKVVATLEPGGGVATIEKIAVNAVMAGCLPEYMDVVVSAIELLGPDLQGDHSSSPTSAHSISPLLILNGPVAKEMGIATGAGGSSVSWRANAAIARAIRLCLINIAGIPGLTDCNTFVWLPKYMYCIAENEDGSPWESLAVEKGFSPTDDVLTCHWVEPPHHLEFGWPVTAQELLAGFCDGLCTVTDRSASRAVLMPVIGFCPDEAHLCANAGFSKRDVKRFLFDHGRKPLRAFGPPAAAKGFPLEWQKFYTHSPEAMVPMVASPENIDIIVIGGVSPGSLYLPHSAGGLRKKIERNWRSPA